MKTKNRISDSATSWLTPARRAALDEMLKDLKPHRFNRKTRIMTSPSGERHHVPEVGN